MSENDIHPHDELEVHNGEPLRPTFVDGNGVERIAGPPIENWTPAQVDPTEEQIAINEAFHAREAERKAQAAELLGQTPPDGSGDPGVTDVTPTDPGAPTGDPTVPATPVTDPTGTPTTPVSSQTDQQAVDAAAVAAADADVAAQVEAERAAAAEASSQTDDAALAAAEAKQVADEEASS